MVSVFRTSSANTSQGGQVDPDFLTNYNAAKAAGINRVDAYLFPCAGVEPTGETCKSLATQLNDFLATIDKNNLHLGHLWLTSSLQPLGQPPVTRGHSVKPRMRDLPKNGWHCLRQAEGNWEYMLTGRCNIYCSARGNALEEL